MSANPNPARITDASWWFMERLLELQPRSQYGGIFANKAGYHNTRNNLWDNPLWEDDYSTRLAADKRGPGDKAAGYDWTFPDAQQGNYVTIMRYMDRIEAAFNARDPRLVGWREALGQADLDRDAEGFDFQFWSRRTPDATHLWHIHLSELREHTESYGNKRAMLSVLSGQSLAEWRDADMAKLVATTDSPHGKGALYATGGGARRWLPSMGAVMDFCQAWGISVTPSATVTEAQADVRYGPEYKPGTQGPAGPAGPPGPATLVPHKHVPGHEFTE